MGRYKLELGDWGPLENNDATDKTIESLTA